MKIKGIDNLSEYEINEELNNGGKFVLFQYCFSIGIMTFKRTSNIYFLKSTDNAFIKGLGFTILTLIVGWWGFPWGPIYTIQSLFRNLTGGIDVTDEVANSVHEYSNEITV